VALLHHEILQMHAALDRMGGELRDRVRSDVTEARDELQLGGGVEVVKIGHAGSRYIASLGPRRAQRNHLSRPTTLRAKHTQLPISRAARGARNVRMRR